jgi:hypothetical protein
MKKSLINFCALCLLFCVWGCHKPNSTNGMFVGTWHQKPGGFNDTVIFFSNGVLQDKLDQTMQSYSIISADTIQINTTLGKRKSYYFFYSSTELGIQSFESNLSGIGYDSTNFIKN